MKKSIFFLILMVPAIYFVACNKTANSINTGCTGTSINGDSAALVKFAADSIMTTRDTTGIYYQIIDSGSGAAPVPTSFLTVTYTGTLMDHTIFDTATKAALQYPLYQLIPGWVYGLPKIRQGGRIKLLIPSALAYGCQGASNGTSVVIPPNAPIYFDITINAIN